VQFFPRAAIFLLYRQLFQVRSGAVTAAIWIGLFATFAANVPNIPIAFIFIGPHYGQTWKDALIRITGSENNDGPDSIFGPVQGALSVALDIYAFILPLPIIARLNLASRKKKQLIALFSVALLYVFVRFELRGSALTRITSGVAVSIVGLVFKIELLMTGIQKRGNQSYLQGPVNICM
jgi:hypothetical protein